MKYRVQYIVQYRVQSTIKTKHVTGGNVLEGQKPARTITVEGKQPYFATYISRLTILLEGAMQNVHLETFFPCRYAPGTNRDANWGYVRSYISSSLKNLLVPSGFEFELWYLQHKASSSTTDYVQREIQVEKTQIRKAWLIVKLEPCSVLKSFFQVSDYPQKPSLIVKSKLGRISNKQSTLCLLF